MNSFLFGFLFLGAASRLNGSEKGQDMDELTFWARFWQAVAAVLCVLILTAGGCGAHIDYRISEMVKSGVNPIDAYCSISAGNASALCTLRASK